MHTEKKEATNLQNRTELSESFNTSAELYRHISLVTREVENRYKEGILAYIDVLARYEEEMSALKQKLSEAKRLAVPEEEKLKIYTDEVRIEERLHDRINSDFLQKIIDYEAFMQEYSPLMEKENVTLLKRNKLAELNRMQDEIEEGEMRLLTLELERLNQIEILKPLHIEIERIEQALAELERKRRYFETTHLHQMHVYPNGGYPAVEAIPTTVEVEDI